MLLQLQTRTCKNFFLLYTFPIQNGIHTAIMSAQNVESRSSCGSFDMIRTRPVLRAGAGHVGLSRFLDLDQVLGQKLWFIL